MIFLIKAMAILHECICPLNKSVSLSLIYFIIIIISILLINKLHEQKNTRGLNSTIIHKGYYFRGLETYMPVLLNFPSLYHSFFLKNILYKIIYLFIVVDRRIRFAPYKEFSFILLRNNNFNNFLNINNANNITPFYKSQKILLKVNN